MEKTALVGKGTGHRRHTIKDNDNIQQKRMKRAFVFIISLLFVTIASFAQTQHGNVKTLGRPGRAGEPLGGVTVRVKGEHNAALSHDDGTFSFVLAGRKNGDAYVLQQVRKQGYELSEQGVIGRQYAFSDKVPLTLVMVNTAQLLADKQHIENTALQVAERNYKQKLALLERQLSEQRITAEAYREQLQQLQQNFEKYQGLIDGLAEHYAHVDYDNLDEKEREINICIENGDLERADSLLSTVFDLVEVLKNSKETLSRIEQQEAEGRQLLAQANADMAAVLKQQEKDAEHLYQLYTIALSRFDNSKARQYIETRAALDTTNVDWQNDAGRFLEIYIGDYRNALAYYQLILRQSVIQFGEESSWSASAYNNLGGGYECLDEREMAMKCYRKALGICEKVEGPECLDAALYLNNIGGVCFSQEKFSEALKYYQKALDIRNKILDAGHPYIAQSYNNIAGVYYEQGKLPDALEFASVALTIQERGLGHDNPLTAKSFNNVGLIYHGLGDFTKALGYHQKALAIREKVLGAEHPDVIQSYRNIGGAYEDMGNHMEALKYFQKALPLHECVFIATVADGDTPARRQQMSGEYIVLSFAHWNIESATSLFDVNAEMMGKPKTVTVMKDGIISQHHFENTIGVRLSLKNVGMQGKKQIIEAYRQYLSANGK